MKASTIPYSQEYVRKIYLLNDLLLRASSYDRATWTDLPFNSGVYAVFWTLREQPSFGLTAGLAKFANITDPYRLQRKWSQISTYALTDIIYLGKAVNLKERVRSLVRFGVGKARNHSGGEWMWQINQISTANILLQTCPSGKEIGFENWLLEQFYNDHKDYPLANREGPEGFERWCPNCHRINV